MSRPETSPQRATHTPTPGPWRVEWRFGALTIEAAEARVASVSKLDEGAEANAALLAAAPALLAALREIVAAQDAHLACVEKFGAATMALDEGIATVTRINDAIESGRAAIVGAAS